MKRFLFILLFFTGLLSGCHSAYAQDAFNINEKWLNRSSFNPAATGTTNYLEITTIARQQWIGMEGAPGTAFLSAQNFFPTISSSFGFSIMSDFIGFYNSQGIKFSYAYHLRLGKKTALSFGLGFGVLTQGRDNTKVSLLDPYDPEYNPEYTRTVQPDFDAGAEFRYERLRVGLSAMHFSSNNSNNLEYSYNRIFNLYASIRIDVDKYMALMPSIITSYTNNRFLGEGGLILYIKTSPPEVSHQRLDRVINDRYDRFWVGANVNFNGSLNAMAGLFITEQWKVGYSFGYHWDFSAIKAATTHEVMVAWRLKTSQPRRYLCLEDCD